MKILFLLKFYEPFDRGGSEWSSHDLATLLTERGHEVTIVTPNYGAKPNQTINGIRIKRFPFVVKLKNPKEPILPLWTNNVFWYIYTSLYVAHFVLKNRPDVIHIQNNEFIPAGVIAGKIGKIHTIATFRDYQSLCNLGFCLWEKDKACKNLSDYIRNDFEFFYKNYVTGDSKLKYLALKAAAIRGWIMQKFIYFFAQKSDIKIAVSTRLSEIFNSNGMRNLHVIHNPVLVRQDTAKATTNNILYIGKLSPGKGIDILMNAYISAKNNIDDLNLMLVGAGILKEKLTKKVEESSLMNRVIFKGQIKHDEVLEILKKASFVVISSVWPEPLPRSAIEALLSGVPVITTNRGGTKEIMNKEYGITCKADSRSLRTAIIKMSKNKDLYRQRILKDRKLLNDKFSTMILNEYLKSYMKKVI